MKNSGNPQYHTASAFTLVELLVVIVAVVTLAALSFSLLPKMRKRADVAKSVQNMRQIGSLFGVYASENSFRLPPARVDSPSHTHWHQALLALAYPSDDSAKFRDHGWWNENKPFMRNPLMKDNLRPQSFRPYWCGYAMNRQIRVNAGLNDADGQWWTVSVPLSSIPDPARTPLVSPRNDYSYSLTDLKNSAIQPFLLEGKLPILFVDGHIESMKPSEYESRKLDLMPRN